MYIGIDLGTTSVKLILIDAKGKLIKTVSRSYELLMPHSMWTEQNPIDWYNSTIDGLKEIVAGNEANIKAISFSGQMHGMVVLDKFEEIIRPAILWNDQRTVAEVKYLNENVSIKKLQEETGNIALTGLTAPKVLWLRNNEPKNFEKISKIMLPKDYLAYKLSAVFATDVSDVSGTLYFDVKRKKYSKYMLELLGINELQLPRVFESYEVIGNLKTELQDLLGLGPNVDIVIGGGDQAVGAVGIGTVGDGKCSISLGTSGVVYVASKNFAIDTQSHMQSYADATGNYHMMGVMLNAAGSLKWWNESVFNNQNYDEFFQRLSKTPIDDSIYFLPYLSGERSPINDSNAQGMFIGLKAEHKKEHMDRALIEGVTFALKQSFDLIRKLGVQIDTIRITGGGAKNPIWAQMIADIMDVNVETIHVDEGPAFGAAILAMVGNGVFSTVEEACKQLVKGDKIYIPNLEFTEIYEKKYIKFVKLYPTVKKIFKEE